MSLAAAALALIALPAGGAAGTAAKPPAGGPDFTALTAAYVEYCAEPFPDSAAFHARVRLPESVFRRSAPGRQPGEHWTGRGITLSYLDASRINPDLPSPQCRVSADIASDTDHLAMAAALAEQLGLDKGRTSGRAGINKTVWNFAADNGTRLRLFMDSRPLEPGRFAASLTLLRLAE